MAAIFSRPECLDIYILARLAGIAIQIAALSGDYK